MYLTSTINDIVIIVFFNILTHDSITLTICRFLNYVLRWLTVFELKLIFFRDTF